MPIWSPNWNAVRWDWGAADGAIGRLRHAADLLEELTAERERAAAEAQREWRGKYREEFDEKLNQLVRRALDLANEFREAANRIAWASQMAWEEQQRRERERARWFAEKEEEERRQRLMSERGGGGSW